MSDYEKLGAFYLGKKYDLEQGETKDDLLLYDSKDLTTHAVCVGMTGSGKTGLCLSLLEEAAIDGIPTIAIDPKGDLGNLALTFPDLQPKNFRPWIDPAEAVRKGMTEQEYAANRAALWKKGLKDWDQDGARIRRFQDAVDTAIYTPGSSAGLPLTVLQSFKAPPAATLGDVDALRSRVTTTVSGLLALLGIDADPIRSREHILLSNILDTAWRAGRSLEIAGLIREIQSPPFQRIGVMELDAFYPPQDRFALSMTLNNLLASPSFGAWLEGEPLDIQRLLWTPAGKPRISILSIAHLSEPERMFFVTLLLNELVTWMRSQPGTGSLRALLYMDEIFGYFPPTANPPSKKPMLTLLKQARAYGLGVVLSTQNPVDLDYKGLSNTGTWFLGRLQTERDKLRVLEGLEGASVSAGAAFDRGKMEATLAGLKSRVFLMNNVHDDTPTLFHTRWALSYLRGPLTQDQIRTLMDPLRTATVTSEPATVPAAPTAAAVAPTSVRPVIPEGVQQWFLPSLDLPTGNERGLYRPLLYGHMRMHWAHTRYGVDRWAEAFFLAPLDGAADPWSSAQTLEEEPQRKTRPEAGFDWADIPPAALKKTSYTRWSRGLKAYAYRTSPLTIYECKSLKAKSNALETLGDFRIRLTQLSHEARDQALEKLRRKFTPKLARLEEQIRKAEARIDREASQYKQQGLQTAVSLGTTVLGALFGRKLASVGNISRAGSAARSAGRAAREKGDIVRAKETQEALKVQLQDLQQQFDQEKENLIDSTDPADLEVVERIVRPRKTDLEVVVLGIIWAPWRVAADGSSSPLE
jgi:hypothetical protein